jgi:hypothetical protein
MEWYQTPKFAQLYYLFIPFDRKIHSEKYKQSNQGKNQKEKKIHARRVKPSPFTCSTSKHPRTKPKQILGQHFEN